MIRTPSPDASRRPSLLRDKHGVSYLETARPNLNLRHRDGPVLFYRSGEVHFLTPWERFRVWMGWDDAASLEARLRPDLAQPAKRTLGPGL